MVTCDLVSELKCNKELLVPDLASSSGPDQQLRTSPGLEGEVRLDVECHSLSYLGLLS